MNWRDDYQIISCTEYVKKTSFSLRYWMDVERFFIAAENKTFDVPHNWIFT